MAFSAGDRRLTSPTAQAIYSAAVDLIYHQGFEATSLRQIAEVVGVKVGSLYNHIASKEELLYNIMHSVMKELIELSQAAVTGLTDPRERLRAFLRTAIEFHAENQHAAFIGNTELRALSLRHRRAIVNLRDTYQKDLEDHIRAVAASNRAGTVPNVKLAAYAAVAIANHVASWYQATGELSLDEVIDGLLGVYRPTADD
ncbi:TetR/AcrR family transcriptional regulator [Nocardia vaccinii]|uniref:TetR/AcrR family transcriptional regulator n=1 Tax=Nocardia vaccinii TaxID=1822 RepID=UPI00082E4E64|nr:TetR/AcrR family transcriptional regulator [Nocardia vaccinii]